jgi:hypothetical protein
VRTVRRIGLAFVLPFAVACAAFLWLGHGPRRPAAAHATAHGAPDVRGLDAAGRTPSEEHALALAIEALASEKGARALRVAEDADAAATDTRADLADLYAEYHPYFLRGDLDGDGRLDFAQAFVEKGRGSAWFHVAVFFGREGGGFDPPVWVERAVSLASGDLSIERTLLVVTPDLAADEARRWRFDRATRTFVDADVAAPLKPGSDDGVDPDEAPRVRI